MVNYSQSTIYKLCCRDPSVTDIYVGSTTNFTRRKAEHKARCNNEAGKDYHYNVYRYIREYGGWSNWDMVEVERYCATDKIDLHTRERYWLEELGATLNKSIPLRSGAEYYTVNKEKIAERRAQYYIENKKKIREQHSQYRAENKEKILEQMAQYYTENKEKILERNAKYRAENKEKIREQRAMKVECECGSSFRKSDILRHRRSHKHQKWVEQNTES